MKACIQHIINVSRKRSAQAMTGTGLMLPAKMKLAGDQKKIIEIVRREKYAERMLGFHSTGVAHPKFISIIKEVYHLPIVLPESVENKIITSSDLLACPTGVRTEYGLRQLIAVTLEYFACWLKGDSACLSLYGALEDVATVELSRTLLWQWIHRGAHLQDNKLIDFYLVEKIIDEEIINISNSMKFPDIDKSSLNETGSFLKQLLKSKQLDDFFTPRAYDSLVAKGK